MSRTFNILFMLRILPRYFFIDQFRADNPEAVHIAFLASTNVARA